MSDTNTSRAKKRKDKVQSETELRARERYFAIINQITQDILEFKDSDEIHHRLITHLVNLFSADYGHLFSREAGQGQVKLLATTLKGNHFTPGTVIEPGEASHLTSILDGGTVLSIEDVPKSGYTVNPGPLRQLSIPTRSALCIPIIIRDFKFGVALIAYETPWQLTQEELSHADEAGRQIALALWTVHQEAEIQKRLKEAQATARIGQMLTETQSVGLAQLLQLIVNSAHDLYPNTSKAVIHLLDEEKNLLIPQAVSGEKEPKTSSINMHPGRGVAGKVLAEGEVISIADVEHDPLFLRQSRKPDYRSLMVAPVQSGTRRLGTISVQSDQANAYSPDQSTLLSTLGTQAAMAIENARIFERMQQGYKEVNALYRITKGLTVSLDTEKLMKDVVDLLQENFGYYHAQIYIMDALTDDLVLHQASGEIGKQMLRDGWRLQAGSGIIGHAAEIGTPFFTNNVEEVIFYVRNPYLPDAHAELAIPIIVNGHVLGVLDVQQTPPAHLTEHDLQLVSAVAEQLAVALQKANLYSDLQTSLQQEKAIRSQLVQSERLALVGRLLASVSHELNNPLQAIQNALYLLKEEKGISEQGRQDLQIVLSEADRMAAMIERLRTSYRPTHKEDFKAVQINHIIEDVHALIATHLRHHKIAFEFHLDPTLPEVSGLPEQLHQVLLNLLMNSVEAMPEGGRLSVSTDCLDEREIRVLIEDTGPGIDPEILPHVFDAFITNKESGTGLGLTITYDIIRSHNGRIIAENSPNQGAIFTFWLPVRGKEA